MALGGEATSTFPGAAGQSRISAERRSGWRTANRIDEVAPDEKAKMAACAQRV
jgi:hypothetical protein